MSAKVSVRIHICHVPCAFIFVMCWCAFKCCDNMNALIDADSYSLLHLVVGVALGTGHAVCVAILAQRQHDHMTELIDVD